MRKLVDSWISAEREHYGNTLGKAIKGLNATLGMQATCSRVSEWRRGVYHPSNIVLSQMLWRTLPWALKKAGIDTSAEAIYRMRNLLWIIEEQGDKGTRYFL